LPLPGPRPALVPGLLGLGPGPAVPAAGRADRQPRTHRPLSPAEDAPRPAGRLGLRPDPRLQPPAGGGHVPARAGDRAPVPVAAEPLAVGRAARLARRPVLPLGGEPRPVGRALRVGPRAGVARSRTRQSAGAAPALWRVRLRVCSRVA